MSRLGRRCLWARSTKCEGRPGGQCCGGPDGAGGRTGCGGCICDRKGRCYRQHCDGSFDACNINMCVMKNMETLNQ